MASQSRQRFRQSVLRCHAPTAGSGTEERLWRADQRLSEKEYAPGTRVRYACSPPLCGVVVKRDGGSHWVEFPNEGMLRCNTYDLRVLKEGE